MSQQEFEKNDHEVMEMVNRSATSDAKIRADKIAEAVTTQIAETTTDTEGECQESYEIVKEIERKYQRKRNLRTILVMVMCITIAAMLIVALFVPSFMVWVVNIGVLCCGMAVAIAVDRWIRRY